VKLDAIERKALILTTFTSSCLCFAPAEIISGVVLLLASMLLYRWDQGIQRREAADAAAAAPAPSPPAPAEPTASTEG
jgi:hypothetical protein